MSRRMQIGLTSVVALGCAAGAFYWLHARAAGPQPIVEPARSVPVASRAAAADTTSKPTLAPGDIARGTMPLASKKVPPAADAEFPLREGEVLDYSADVSKLTNVANVRLQVGERKNFLGKSVWHLQAFAHTESPLRMVFELDDEFDSYSDAGTMASLQYEMHLNERGQKVESIQRMTTTGKEPAPANVTEARVVPGTRDPLGFMQYLRHVNWTKTPDVRSPVYDGRKLYEVQAQIEGPAYEVTVPAGSYRTSKIEIRVFENGAEVKDSQFTLYLAENAGRTPVLLEAVLPFASAKVQLLRAK